MKSIIFVYIVMVSMVFSSCNYLDVMPDTRAKIEDSYNTPSRTEGFLYSCYSYLPKKRMSNIGSTISVNPIDRLTGGETTSYYKAGENGGVLTAGKYTPAAPLLAGEVWNTCMVGIRQCYEFLDIIDQASVSIEEERTIFKSEALFLIAYYHFHLLQAFGPSPIIRHKFDPDISDFSEMPARSSYDDVVKFIDETLEQAMPGLVDTHTPNNFGRATKHVARALRSRMYLYAASPLFNGNSEFYNDFVDADGKHLISQEYSVKKWEKSAEVTLDAIREAEKVYHLYGDVEAGEPTAAKPGFTSSTESGKAQRRVRYCFMDAANLCEVIMGDNRTETLYDVQIRSSVRQTKQAPFAMANSTAPTLQMVELFYTKNGLPIDKDEEYGYSERYELINLPKNFDGNMYADRPNDQTIKLHLNREPRFYSWIGFANGNYEISRYNAVDLAFNKAYVPGGLKMVAGGAHGWKTGQTTHFSVTGYLNKKFTHPGLTTKLIQYPFPVFRLAELYLNYAEALIETGNPANYSIARNYIDKVRVRAGIPIIEESLEHATSDWKGKKDDQEVLRQIVRQERQIEFYLENQRFWDLRRWKKAEALNEHFKGWNIAGTSIIEFFKEPQNNPFLTNSFSREHYLMPVPLSEIERMPQLIQNPYYK